MGTRDRPRLRRSSTGARRYRSLGTKQTQQRRHFDEALRNDRERRPRRRRVSVLRRRQTRQPLGLKQRANPHASRANGGSSKNARAQSAYALYSASRATAARAFFLFRSRRSTTSRRSGGAVAQEPRSLLESSRRRRQRMLEQTRRREEALVHERETLRFRTSLFRFRHRRRVRRRRSGRTRRLERPSQGGSRRQSCLQFTRNARTPSFSSESFVRKCVSALATIVPRTEAPARSRRAETHPAARAVSVGAIASW